jgi:hypothetical protein
LPSRTADRAHYRRHGIVTLHTKRTNEIRVQEGRHERGKALTAAAKRIRRRKNLYWRDRRIADLLNTSANETD